MYEREEVQLLRDVGAIQIPDGTAVMLTEGMPLLITQQLGGSFTVMNDRGAMYRIDDRNADALGKEVSDDGSAAGGTLEDQVWAQMKKCYDPEIPVNIVDLGLVYSCEVTEADDGESDVDITMTLTAPGCGMGPVLAEDVKRRVEGLETVREARVAVVFDPPWNQNMMTEAARLQLGFI